jgi:hypothetical protein
MFLFTRENRTDKCTACSSFQHTIQTLRDVYENTLTQKDNHIRYPVKKVGTTKIFLSHDQERRSKGGNFIN